VSRFFRHLKLYFALGVVFAHPAIALDPDRVKSQYAHDSWGSEKGLAGEVHAITQTNDGYLWIGTEKGLFRFDGLSFRPVTDRSPSPVSIVNVMGLAVNAQGSLIVRLPERHLLRYADGKFENALDPLEPRELAVTAMCRGKDGDLLLVGLFHGLLRQHDGRFETMAPVTSLPSSPIISMTESADGKVWLGTREAGLFYLDGNRVIAVRGELPSRRINSLLADGNGVWIGTDGGIARWNGTAITNEGVPPSLRRAHVLAMLRDTQSNLWVGTGSGLMGVDGGGAAPLDNPERRPGAAVNALFEDQEGNLWAGGPWGIERWRDGTFTTYGKPEGLPSDHNGAIYADSGGRTWFAPLVGGLYWLNAGPRAQVAQAGLMTDVVYSIGGNNGDLWIGRQRGGLTRLRDQAGGLVARTFTQADGLAQNSVYSVYLSRDGTVWAGTLSGGVSRYHDGKFTTYSAADGLASNTVTSILESSDGTMWFATPNGLRALSDNRWRGYTVKEGLPSDEVNCVVEDSKGILWIGTAAGLAFLNGGNVETPRGVSAQLHQQVFGLAQDKSGELWVATSDRIVRINRDKVFAGALAEGDVREFVIADGLRSVNGVRRDRSVVADRLGRIWFSTDTGLSVVNPSQLASSPVPAFAHIEAISADNSVIDVHGPVRIPAATRRITFAYSGGSLTDPARVRFRYQLVGYDPGWSVPTAAREAAYTNVGPGSYRFRVSASNNGGVWNEAGAFLDFTLAPTYYQTPWFRFSAVAAVLALLAALYQLRSRQVARQFNIRMEERVNERIRIARDLHDTLLQSFQGVLMQFHAVTYLLPDRPAEARNKLETVIEQARQAVTEGRDALEGLRSSTMVTNDLARAINTLGEELAAEQTGRHAPQFRVHVEGTTRNLPPILRDEIYRLACEALRNAFRHAQARRIEVEIRYEQRHFRLRVRDDGKGIDAKVLGGGRPGHYGLAGMHERAKLVGGKLAVWSELDSGTEVELVVPGLIAYLKEPVPPQPVVSGRGA
jgi:signal transduction histidine kinase